MHLAHPHQPRPAPHSPPSEQDHFFRFIFAIYVSLRPHRNHRFTWCIPISLSQLHAAPPSEQHSFFIFIFANSFSVRPRRRPQIHLVHPHQPAPVPHSPPSFSKFIFASFLLPGPTGTTDSPGASPSVWANSTQASQRAKPLFLIYFHDLFSCAAPPGPQIHLVHPHQPRPVPHRPPSEQHRFFSSELCWRFIVLFGPTGTTDSPGASPSAWASQRAKPLFQFYFYDLCFCPAPPGTTDPPGASPSA